MHHLRGHAPRPARAVRHRAAGPDIVPIERTREFRGLYHVLGGALSPLDGVEPDDLHITELVDRVDDDVHEVILATNPTMTGDGKLPGEYLVFKGEMSDTRSNRRWR